MSRAPDPWYAVASQWAIAPIVAPILVIILRHEVEWPLWLVRLLFLTRLTSAEKRAERP